MRRPLWSSAARCRDLVGRAAMRAADSGCRVLRFELSASPLDTARARRAPSTSSGVWAAFVRQSPLEKRLRRSVMSPTLLRGWRAATAEAVLVDAEKADLRCQRRAHRRPGWSEYAPTARAKSVFDDRLPVSDERDEISVGARQTWEARVTSAGSPDRDLWPFPGNHPASDLRPLPVPARAANIRPVRASVRENRPSLRKQCSCELRGSS